MKKLITTTLLVLFFGYVYAQKDVTTFLGIPVDGKKKEITKKLKAKGFKYDYNTKTLRGIFNGMDSYVYIQTNKDNLVHSISVVDVNPTPVVLIKYRYNNLIEEFSGKKDKYVEVDNYQPIPEDENIDYEMSVHKKLYKAKFCQIPNMDLFKNENNNQRVYNRLRQTFTSSQLVNPTDDEEKEI